MVLFLVHPILFLHFSPIFCDMTFVAAQIESSEMHIICLVAGVTIRFQFHPPEGLLVAFIAFGLAVLARQWIGGVAVMFKYNGLESTLDMATIAFFPISSSVPLFHVITLMAIKTLCPQFFIDVLARVAAVTFDFFVLMPQRELCIPVVPEGTGFKSFLVVTGIAFLTIATFMALHLVIIFMATMTAAR